MTPFNILEIVWGILVCFFYMFEGLVRYVQNYIRLFFEIHFSCRNNLEIQ